MLTPARVAHFPAGLVLAAVLLHAAPGEVRAVAPPTTGTEGVAAPRLPAPLGLSFGMRPEEVALAVVVPPAPLGTVAPLRPPPAEARGDAASTGATAAAPTPLFPSAPPTAPVGTGSRRTPILGPAPPRPSIDVVPPRFPLDGLGDYVRACETAFDRISALAAPDREWLSWRAAHLRGGEGSDFTDDLADRTGITVAPAPALVRAADAWRSAGLYRFDGADGRRLVCLLFTAEGLAQVFFAGHALDGLRDEVIARLQRQRRLEGFTATREARRFSLSLRRPACGLYCRLFGERMLIERQLWLDPRARILVAAKRGLIVSGLAGAFSGAESEVFDGLPDSFLVSIDLSRRAAVPRQQGPVPPWTQPASAKARDATPAAAPASALIQSFVP